MVGTSYYLIFKREFEQKLNRKLLEKELEFIKWLSNQYESKRGDQ